MTISRITKLKTSRACIVGMEYGVKQKFNTEIQRWTI